MGNQNSGAKALSQNKNPKYTLPSHGYDFIRKQRASCVCLCVYIYIYISSQGWDVQGKGSKVLNQIGLGEGVTSKQNQ